MRQNVRARWRRSDGATPAITLWCCGCNADIRPRLTTGREIYPHRGDLSKLPFWKCDACKNFVGCHHKTSKPTTPLGCIPTKAIKAVRQEIHRALDPLWQSKRISRRDLYGRIAQKIGVPEYHTAEIRSPDVGRRVLAALSEIDAALCAPSQENPMFDHPFTQTVFADFRALTRRGFFMRPANAKPPAISDRGMVAILGISA